MSMRYYILMVCVGVTVCESCFLPDLVQHTNKGSLTAKNLVFCDAAIFDQNIDFGPYKGHTLLSLAVVHDGLIAVNALLNAGADPNGATATGKLPIEFAAAESSLPVFEALVDHGARISESVYQGAGKRPVLFHYLRDCALRENDYVKRTYILNQLLLGVCDEHELDKLLKYGAHADTCAATGESVLDRIAWHPRMKNIVTHHAGPVYDQLYEHIIKGTLTPGFLDAHFTGIKKLTIVRTFKQAPDMSALCLAITSGHPEYVRLLLQYGARLRMCSPHVMEKLHGKRVKKLYRLPR